MVSDQLVIHNFTGNASISLVPEKITFFSIAGHRFRYIATAALATTGLAPAAPNLPEPGSMKNYTPPGPPGLCPVGPAKKDTPVPFYPG